MDVETDECVTDRLESRDLGARSLLVRLVGSVSRGWILDNIAWERVVDPDDAQRQSFTLGSERVIYELSWRKRTQGTGVLVRGPFGHYGFRIYRTMTWGEWWRLCRLYLFSRRVGPKGSETDQDGSRGGS